VVNNLQIYLGSIKKSKLIKQNPFVWICTFLKKERANLEFILPRPLASLAPPLELLAARG